mgnify:CR=1 FL=1|jgi:hypothetical protein
MENDILHPNLKNEETLEERFARERKEWDAKVAELSSKMNKLVELPSLMTTLYTERQRAVEYYHYLMSLLIGMNKRYNAAYAERNDFYMFKSQVRYSSEGAKHNRILVDLADMVEKREIMQNHARFIEKTVGTLDNIVYAVPRRVEIEQIMRGK